MAASWNQSIGAVGPQQQIPKRLSAMPVRVLDAAIDGGRSTPEAALD
jgi:hypothetical protein